MWPWKSKGCEYFVLKVMRSLRTGEAQSLGVVVLCPEARWARIKFAPDVKERIEKIAESGLEQRVLNAYVSEFEERFKKLESDPDSLREYIEKFEGDPASKIRFAHGETLIEGNPERILHQIYSKTFSGALSL